MRTVILFSGKNCGYCKPIKIMLDDMKTDYEDNDNVQFMTRIIDAEPTALELAKSYGVRAIPTLVVLQGKEVEHFWVGEEIKRESVINGIEGNL